MEFDAYTTYSESSPRTPSPPSSDYSDSLPRKESYENHRVFVQEVQDDVPETHSIDFNYWHGADSQTQNPFAFNPASSRGSLLQELYESEGSPSDDLYLDRPSSNASSYRPSSSESAFEQQPENWHPHQQQLFFQNREYTPMRRNTFPYVRHDHREQSTSPHPQYPAYNDSSNHGSRQDALYSDPMPLAADPSSLHGEQYGSPHSSYRDFDESTGVKLEDSPTIVPAQGSFYRQSPGGHAMSLTYISPETGLPVQYTDDAASKETQYLRRRCFNCHTTEPPSWRRSTLNPGKIVCNKCGLYERTHLRPRPLRFDELRAGNKARKQTKALSPKAKLLSATGIKKEPREFAIARRSSVSSSNSSASGSSDWEDNVSLYSNSTPSSSYNSPSIPSFPIPRDSQSPPIDGAIRLPNAPLSDIASLQRRERSLSAASAHSHGQARRKAHTAGPYFNASASNSSPHLMLSPPDFFRRGSMPNIRGEAAVWAERSSPLSGASELMQHDDHMLSRVTAVAS